MHLTKLPVKQTLAQVGRELSYACQTISEHMKHIFEDGGLDPTATVRSFQTVQSKGDREASRDVEFYNLDMVIALGFRAGL